MEEHREEENMLIFSQDGVLLKEAPTFYINFINSTGSLIITEYLNSNKTRFIEWKPNENQLLESELQDQEWSLVSAVERNSTISQPAAMKSKYIKINMQEIKSFKTSRQGNRLALLDGMGETMYNFFFQHGNCNALVQVLKGLLVTTPSRRDKSLYVVIDEMNDETRQLDTSFAVLDLFQDGPSNYNMWNLLKNLQQKPYETTLEAFAKIADIVTTTPHERPIDEHDEEIINRNITAFGTPTATRTQDEYEVVLDLPKLPERLDYPRGDPVNLEQWKNLQGRDGRLDDTEMIKLQIFRGGLVPSLRIKVWKYLLDYFPWDSSQEDREILMKQKCEEYYVMKRQWKTLTRIQEENFADFRERKSLIEKDVNRTDRTIDFYAGDNNPNLQTLHEILMTYVMYNFDLGYVQGMSDLLSPILYLLNNEVDAFWCFVGFMNKVSSNFDIDQAGMKEQLENLHTLIKFVDPPLSLYLDQHESGNMFFCFRWLLVWFKRELNQDDVMRLWEVLWTGLPCKNFHLLICVAILQTEKDTLIENNYGFTEILKHVNDLSGHLDVNDMLNKAEGIFNQIMEAKHLNDGIRIILGLPLLGITLGTSPNDSTSSIEKYSFDSGSIGDNEVGYERALSSSYL